MAIICFPVFPLQMATSLSTQDVSMVLRHHLSMEETRDLVFQMGVPLNILDDVATTYTGENRKQHFFMKAWLDITPNASWDQLVSGLRIINKIVLAAEIESKYVPKPSATSNGSQSPLRSSSVPVSVPPQSFSIDPLPHPNQTFEQRVAVAAQLRLATTAPLPQPQRCSRRLGSQKPLSPSHQVEEEWSGVSPTPPLGGSPLVGVLPCKLKKSIEETGTVSIVLIPNFISIVFFLNLG